MKEDMIAKEGGKHRMGAEEEKRKRDIKIYHARATVSLILCVALKGHIFYVAFVYLSDGAIFRSPYGSFEASRKELPVCPILTNAIKLKLQMVLDSGDILLEWALYRICFGYLLAIVGSLCGAHI